MSVVKKVLLDVSEYESLLDYKSKYEALVKKKDIRGQGLIKKKTSLSAKILELEKKYDLLASKILLKGGGEEPLSLIISQNEDQLHPPQLGTDASITDPPNAVVSPTKKPKQAKKTKTEPWYYLGSDAGQ